MNVMENLYTFAQSVKMLQKVNNLLMQIMETERTIEEIDILTQDRTVPIFCKNIKIFIKQIQ